MKSHDTAYIPQTAQREHFKSKRVRVDPAGRIVLPATIRKTLEIRNGDVLVISVNDRSVRLHTVDAALERVRAIARRKRATDSNIVDQFIAERRSEAAPE